MNFYENIKMNQWQYNLKQIFQKGLYTCVYALKNECGNKSVIHFDGESVSLLSNQRNEILLDFKQLQRIWMTLID